MCYVAVRPCLWRCPMIPPFVRVGERLYLVANWNPETADREWLLLRPLSDGEDEMVREWELNSCFEVWAQIVASV